MRLEPDRSDLLRLERALLEIGREFSDPRRMLEEVAAQAVYPAIVDIFDNEGYGAWGGLTQAAAREKARSEFAGQPLLQRTGALRTSLTLRGAPGNIHQFDDSGTLIIGSDLPYFGVQNDLRPIAQFQEEHFDHMANVAVDHLADASVKAGFEVRVEE